MTEYLSGRVAIVQGDITKLEVDGIVNAANASLLGGGGVDGAIHRAAGPELKEECQRLGGARTGEVKLTKGYGLKAHYVLHAVGPVWHGGDAGESELLASCYRNALELAREHAMGSVAFPAISTGVYGYPIVKATVVAQSTVRSWVDDHADDPPGRIVLCCFSDADRRVYDRVARSELS